MKVKELINLITGEFSKVEYVSYNAFDWPVDTLIIKVKDTPDYILDLDIKKINLGYYLEIGLDYNCGFDHYRSYENEYRNGR